MKTLLVVEGETDRAVLSRLLEDLRSPFPYDFYVAHGRDAGRPVARRLLMLPCRVGFIYDADTTDMADVNDEKRALISYFGWTARADNVLVQPFVPELEEIFFYDPIIIRSILGRDLLPEQFEAAKVAPKTILVSLLRARGIGSVAEFACQMASETVDMLRKHPSVQAIRAFVEQR
ncbi:MAG: hypothetical protein IT428_18475 [Planctomycetaceae bacterium]|nr:hypothetical protein [Planctomycetaceae bacterium]